MSMSTSITIYWFRNALRLHDNPSLLHACQHHHNIGKKAFMFPIYIIDPSCPFAQTKQKRVGPVRANFVLESLNDLNAKFEKKLQSNVIVLKGDPRSVLLDVVSNLKSEYSKDNPVIHLVYEKENSVPMRELDRGVLAALTEEHAKVKVRSFDTHSLFQMEHYVAKCKDGVAPTTYLGFRKIFNKMGNVPAEVDTIDDCPPLPELKRLYSLSFAEDKKCFIVPSLQMLGYSDSESQIWREDEKCTFIGGEDEGLKLFERMKSRQAWVAAFEKPKTLPNALVPDTTGLSAYLKHGCVSPRRFYHALSEIYDLFKKHSEPPVSLHGQLMWREFNYLHGYTTPNFDAMVGNPNARQIPWDDDPKLIEAWRNGRTGYPFIDAIMTQLRTTGWVHHLARHAVACFLTRGDLWISWEKGATVFEELLIDADWSINNFNWQWLSCTAHFHMYFRCYSPIAFGKKTDPNGDYIRKWLPQFKDFPKKYIFEPWLAPLEIQRNCDVVIGVDYPEPIVSHQSVSKANMQRMKGESFRYLPNTCNIRHCLYSCFYLDAYELHKQSESNGQAQTLGSSNSSSKRRRK